VGAIGPFEWSEYLGLAVIYGSLAVTAPALTGARAGGLEGPGRWKETAGNRIGATVTGHVSGEGSSPYNSPTPRTGGTPPGAGPASPADHRGGPRGDWSPTGRSTPGPRPFAR
jgi:hypothetical protein